MNSEMAQSTSRLEFYSAEHPSGATLMPDSASFLIKKSRASSVLQTKLYLFDNVCVVELVDNFAALTWRSYVVWALPKDMLMQDF